ncbi:DMP19 family protein [Xylanibacter caecicola]|uniref:DMP19 family protein n=1 Tax=Xylanibacter caecicola TaxID=2736294 RepID=UPI0025902023|nr:DMP19 family protein [Xylanibacter caecicola]
MDITKVVVRDADLQQAATGGMDSFIDVFVGAIYESVGGKLDAETMSKLNASQITLLAYRILRDEVMDGGFVQLIHNGYGGFIFLNPFARAVKEWGLVELGRLVRKVHSLYKKYRGEIEQDCTDDEFMAMFEKYPEFDQYDDIFVENEEEWTAMVAHYIDDNIGLFAEITND